MILDKEDLIPLIEEGLSQQSIANRLFVTKGVVSAALRKYSLKTNVVKNKSFYPSCKYCKTSLTNRVKIYCDNVCKGKFERSVYISSWLRGEKKGWISATRALSNHIRKWIKETRGSSCEECGWNEVHPTDGKSLTEIDHIDGNAENCNVNNLKILCPNCHSMTPTFRARNKNSKRKI